MPGTIPNTDYEGESVLAKTPVEFGYLRFLGGGPSAKSPDDERHLTV